MDNTATGGQYSLSIVLIVYVFYRFLISECILYRKKEAVFQAASLKYTNISVQNLHGFSAAAGDYVACLHVEQLVADGAVDIAFLFCPNHAVQTTLEFVFHKLFLSRGYFT